MAIYLNNTTIKRGNSGIPVVYEGENLDAALEDHGDAITEQDALIANIQTALEGKTSREEIFRLILASGSNINLIGEDVRVKECIVQESSSFSLSSCSTEITSFTIYESSSFSLSSCDAKITGCAVQESSSFSLSSCDAKITECLFTDSSSFNSKNSNSHLEYCTISNDTDFKHGGGHCTLINCVFDNCSINLNAYEVEASYTITNCIFHNCIWDCDYTSGALHDALVAGGNIINGVPVT